MRKLLFLLFFLSPPAMAHDAPTGWTYGWQCCSGIDCKQAAKDQVKETPQGYKINSDSEVIETLVPYGSSKIHPSKDEFFHICSHISTDKTLICLYVPPKGT